MQSPKYLVLYHANCLDGIAAAWVAYQALSGTVVTVPVQYGEPCHEPIDRYDAIYLVDFSYPIDDLYYLASKTEKLVVIDHHESAIRKLQSHIDSLAIYKDDGIEIEAAIDFILDTAHAGCILAWKYFNAKLNISVPEVLLHIEDRDLWRFNLAGTKAICAGLYSQPLTIDMLDLVINDIERYKEIFGIGTTLLDAEANQRDSVFPSAHILSIAGQKCWAINAPMFMASELGQKMIDELNYEEDMLLDVAAVYTRVATNKWKFSLRSTKGGTNVAQLAEYYGGGGHPSAAGFCIESLEEL